MNSAEAAKQIAIKNGRALVPILADMLKATGPAWIAAGLFEITWVSSEVVRYTRDRETKGLRCAGKSLLKERMPEAR